MMKNKFLLPVLIILFTSMMNFFSCSALREYCRDEREQEKLCFAYSLVKFEQCSNDNSSCQNNATVLLLACEFATNSCSGDEYHN